MKKFPMCCERVGRLGSVLRTIIIIPCTKPGLRSHCTRQTRLGVDMVKPWNSVRIILVLGLSGPDIRPGLDNRHLIIEGHRGL